MGLKDFMNKMAEKQAESDEKIRENREKFKESVDALKSDKQKQKELEKREDKERTEQLKKDHIPFCPKCHSTSLTYVNKKLSIGRAVVGSTLGVINPLAGVAGATLGGLSSQKGKIKCLNCGHTWKI